MPVPYKILTPRLVLRCYNPGDASLLKQAIDESLEHLIPWMPWAKHEPTSLEAKVERLRKMRGNYDLDLDYALGIFNTSEDILLGSTGLHKRLGPEALEIGYWIHKDYLNQGYATETAGALTKVAFDYFGVERVEIHCDPHNLRSAAMPRKLGYEHEATLRQRDKTPSGQPRDTMVWTLFHKNYLRSPLKDQSLKVYNGLGEMI